MSQRFLALALATGMVLVSACDRPPTDPSVDVESLLRATNPALADLAPVSSTLPALFREAAAKVDAEQGHVGVDAMLGEWHRLQNDLRNSAVSADRAAVQAKVDAIHQEELKIVLRELGPSVLTRVMSDLSLGTADAQTRIALGGKSAAMDRATSLTIQVREQTAAARAALINNDPLKALDIATRAANLLSGLDYFLVELQRVNGLEMLYPDAVNKAQTAKARTEIAAVDAANAAARKALKAGDRELASQKLNEARASQVRVVLSVLGPSAASTLVRQISSRTEQLQGALKALEINGHDVVRYQRMLFEANDLAKRARTALAKGDDATALDLGSHAAGLLNALQHATSK